MKDGYEILRSKMVKLLSDRYGIADQRVLSVMGRVPRHLFVPEAMRHQAYKDNALPIASNQTISQPFIVARMTELLGLKPDSKVLEIGAGSGYQTAVLANLAGRVFAIERLPNLASEADSRLRTMGYRNVTLKCGDGTEGWDVYSPFDAILVAAGGPEAPRPLLDQLKTGGRLVIPIGPDPGSQHLVRITRSAERFVSEDCGPCTFVPLIGSHGWKAG